MTAWTTSATDRGAALLAPGLLLALGLLLAAGAPCAAADRAAPAPHAVTPAADASILSRHLEKGEKALGRAEGAVQGRDPGRVSLLLKRVDDEIAEFESRSGLRELQAAVETARDAARGGNFAAVSAALGRGRALVPRLADYAILREAELAVRQAQTAAEHGDTAATLAAVDRFEGAVLPGVLLRRLAEAREAVARARTDMVRRDMKGGAQDVAAVRHALNGLRYAGALSRAAFGLGIGSELMQQGALIAARDQVQHALRDLRAAKVLFGGPLPDGLAQAEASTAEVWRRSTRPDKEDAGRLLEAQRAVVAIRSRQG